MQYENASITVILTIEYYGFAIDINFRSGNDSSIIQNQGCKKQICAQHMAHIIACEYKIMKLRIESLELDVKCLKVEKKILKNRVKDMRRNEKFIKAALKEVVGDYCDDTDDFSDDGNDSSDETNDSNDEDEEVEVVSSPSGDN